MQRNKLLRTLVEESSRIKKGGVGNAVLQFSNNWGNDEWCRAPGDSRRGLGMANGRGERG